MTAASLRRLRSLGAVFAALALVAGWSCKTFDLPDEICDPARLDAKRLAGGPADGPCSRCLENNCCDAVGVCERTDRCPEIVSSVHACVLREPLKEAARERGCADEHGLGTVHEADEAYRCMRKECGRECGLPVCQVAPAAVLLQNATCDGCFAGSCCAELNACYEMRACKLMIECIVDGCGSELGYSLVALGSALAAAGPPEGGTSSPESICADGGAAALGGPECIRNCLCTFRNNDQGLQPLDVATRPFGLAQKVYECGARASCGPLCTGRSEAGAR